MELFTTRPGGDALALTVWGSLSSWTLTALPLFIWMGEILFRTRLSEEMFRGFAPWLNWLPGRLMHVNVLACGVFGSVSGSSAATCATVAKIALPELKKRGYWAIGLDGSATSALEGMPRFDRVVLVLGSEGDGLSARAMSSAGPRPWPAISSAGTRPPACCCRRPRPSATQ